MTTQRRCWKSKLALTSFVGDSVGTNVLGYASETEVTIEDITHHLTVRRGASQSYVLADLPYASYETQIKRLRMHSNWLLLSRYCQVEGVS